MREATACQQCRRTKRRCIRVESQDPCGQCAKRQSECSFVVPSPRPGPGAEPVPLSKIDLPEEVIRELVGHYLSKIHDRPHSLFHPPTLKENIRNGHVNQSLLFAICAMGSRFSHDPQIRLLEPQLISESKRFLKADLENICLENIQTCVLVANLCAAHSVTSTEALFFGEHAYPDPIFSYHL
jgi:hypothetical protein